LDDGAVESALAALNARVGGSPGSVPPQGPSVVLEGGLRFSVDFATSHKTGLFLDQREQRLALRSPSKGRTVLDLCSYAGGFALNALAGGAKEVTAVDLDEVAVAALRLNAQLNGFATRTAAAQEDGTFAAEADADADAASPQAADLPALTVVHADAFRYCKAARREGKRFDVVVLDPPKLVRGDEDDAAGRLKYLDLNRLAAGLVRPGGLLVTCSCSGRVSGPDFEQLVKQGAREAGKKLRIHWRGGPGDDHPPSPVCPELNYLKVLWAYVESDDPRNGVAANSRRR
jgi:23S rRNA (cytosine1962-C5)-methyltransferase